MNDSRSDRRTSLISLESRVIDRKMIKEASRKEIVIVFVIYERIAKEPLNDFQNDVQGIGVLPFSSEDMMKWPIRAVYLGRISR